MTDLAPNGSKPGIDQLLIRSALDADLRQRLAESPDQVFREFDLTEEQQELLRRPDHRLLPLLGAALARQAGPCDPLSEASASGLEPDATPPPHAAPTPPPHAAIRARTLPDISLALTVVPCARIENGECKGFSYAVWVNPLPEGADPANLPPPGASLPGQPLSPLHLVIQISAVELQDAAGKPQVGLSASLRQSSNTVGPPSPESAGTPEVSPFGSDLRSEGVRAAVRAVRNAPRREERYDRLIDLMQALRGGEVR
ncbi:MAG: hypothetical protein LAQ69_02540 [Acidobacteriia bacterium]|nr:hypothetical protein [Terriglobia bacterium]